MQFEWHNAWLCVLVSCCVTLLIIKVLILFISIFFFLLQVLVFVIGVLFYCMTGAARSVKRWPVNTVPSFSLHMDPWFHLSENSFVCVLYMHVYIDPRTLFGDPYLSFLHSLLQFAFVCFWKYGLFEAHRLCSKLLLVIYSSEQKLFFLSFHLNLWIKGCFCPFNTESVNESFQRLSSSSSLFHIHEWKHCFFLWELVKCQVAVAA